MQNTATTSGGHKILKASVDKRGAWYMFYRAAELLTCHVNDFVESPLLPVAINFLISSCITSLICVIVSKFRDTSVLVLIGPYLVALLVIMVTVLYQWSNLALLSCKFLRERNQFKRKSGTEVSRTCQIIKLRIGSFYTIHLNVLGIVIEAVINYTVMLHLNIGNI